MLHLKHLAVCGSILLAASLVPVMMPNPSNTVYAEMSEENDPRGFSDFTWWQSYDVLRQKYHLIRGVNYQDGNVSYICNFSKTRFLGADRNQLIATFYNRELIRVSFNCDDANKDLEWLTNEFGEGIVVPGIKVQQSSPYTYTRHIWAGPYTYIALDASDYGDGKQGFLILVTSSVGDAETYDYEW